MVKIKFNLGSKEIRNCYATVIKNNDGTYALFFDDGVSFDPSCKFDPILRCFYAWD